MRTLALLPVVLLACGEPAEKPLGPDLQLIDGIGSHNPAGIRDVAIFGGSPAGSGAVQSTVSLHQVDSRGIYIAPFCSGTLIDGDVVLTAAHCLDTAKGGGNFRTMNPGDLAIRVGTDPLGAYDDGTFLDGLYLVSETVINSGYDRRRLHNDAALVRTTDTVTERTPVAPLPASVASTDLVAGAPITFAGFGRTEVDNGGVLLEADSNVGGLGCTVSGCSDSGVAATQFSYPQPSAGPCNGDSGGPAFLTSGGVEYVAGITSYGDANCTIYGVSTRVDAFESWISGFTGTTPPPPPVDTGEPPVDTGEPPPSGDTCGDGTCDVGESCDGRYGTQSCSSDCAGRTNGKPSNRYCIVEGVCEGPGC